MILLKGSEGLLDLSTGVGLGLNFIIGILDPFLGYKNLLGNLHKSSKRVIKRKNMIVTNNINEGTSKHLTQKGVG